MHVMINVLTLQLVDTVTSASPTYELITMSLIPEELAKTVKVFLENGEVMNGRYVLKKNVTLRTMVKSASTGSLHDLTRPASKRELIEPQKASKRELIEPQKASKRELNEPQKAIMQKKKSDREGFKELVKDTDVSFLNNGSTDSVEFFQAQAWGVRLDIVTRKEVEELKEAMKQISKKLQSQYDPYACSDYTSLMKIVEQERQLYEGVFDKLIKQISVNMAERGDALKSLRDHYASLFARVPTYVKRIYDELNAHKALNGRMKEEMTRLQGTLESVILDLEFLKFNQENEESNGVKLAKTADSAIPMKRYLDLYSLRLGRLEKTLKHSEDERLFWVESVKHLILKYGKEHRMNSLIDFHRREQLRYSDVNAKIAYIQDFSLGLFYKIDEHFRRLMSLMNDLCSKLEVENGISMSVLFKLKLEMTNFSEILPVNMDETSAPIMGKISISDIETLVKYLTLWNEQLQVIGMHSSLMLL